MQAISLNGQLIAYRHRPSSSRTLVFANSLGSDQSIWDQVITGIGRGYGILTYDLRGHGQSGLATTDFSIEDMADDLIALLDALNLQDVLLCGVSVGDMIAQSVACKRPDMLAGLVLLNTAAKIGSEERWNNRINDVTRKGLDAIADSVIENWFGNNYAKHSQDMLKLHRNMLCRNPDAGYAAICMAIRDADLTANTQEVTVPTLCIGGQEDRSVTADDVRTLSSLIKGARVEILDGIGHLPPLEAPSEIIRLIEEFDTVNQTRFDKGMEIRRAVLGNAHVDRAEAAKTEFDLAFQTLITEGAWGTVWANENISRRERSMITLALLAALGNFEEIPMHVRATVRTGASERDIQEAFQHVAVYAGVPRANHAIKLAKQTLAEMKTGAQDD